MFVFIVLFLGAISGLVGAFAMTGFMLKVSSTYSKRVDMVKALGSFFTHKPEGAEELGKKIHALSGLLFGIIYFVAMYLIGALTFPYPIFLGIGFGFFHGLIMSYVLMFYASEKHPIEEYREATLEEGLLHLVGHVIFGAVVGLMGAFFSLGF
ncbi:MAG: hypothetical protein ACJAYS_000622 [Lentimonas sp.]|jgi:hypothetical protein